MTEPTRTGTPTPEHATTDTRVERLMSDLRRPEAYAQRPGEVGFLQTHCSLLFFTEGHVYKVKKPVDFGFLDFTTLELRRQVCEEEVRLNRRLAGDVYRGVVPIREGADGQLVVDGGEGAVFEWAVEMQRLPASRMFSALLERGEIDNARIHELVDLVARFHAVCPTGPGVDEHGTVAAVRANAAENFVQLEPHLGDVDVPGGATPSVLTRPQHDFLSARSDAFLDEHTELFERRIAEGRIREGHGDLHAGNLCFTERGVVAYDCIEFNRRFRCGDVAAELAFLAMDLDQRGYPAFSSYLVKRYADRTLDDDLIELTRFYKGYRAIVRAKVAAMTASDPAVGEDQRESLRREAMRYIQLAAAYELPPAMVLLCGLPACGKSWLAERLAPCLRATNLSSDVRRKVLARMSPDTHAHSAYGAGLYSPENKARTYASLLDDAVDGVLAGHSVIVDATFSTREQRRPFVDAAARLELPYYVVHLTADETLIRERLAERERGAKTRSDAGLDVYLRARDAFEPPTETPAGHVVEAVSGTGPAEAQSSRVIDAMIAAAQSA